MGTASSRVVGGNARFSGTREWLHVNVWFRDRSDLQRLIDALTELRDSGGDQPDHVHLQHYDLAAGKHVGLAEINFFRPGRSATAVEEELIRAAEVSLTRGT